MTLLRPLRPLLLALALALVAVPAATAASRPAAAKPIPQITGVAPTKLAVGDWLTIRGRGFVAGKFKNTVVFKRDGGRAVFTKADLATTKRLRVQVPQKLEAHLARKDGFPTSTPVRLRVLAKRFGKTFTVARLTPRIGPANVSTDALDDDCDDDGIKNDVDPDDDNDHLTDALEVALKLKPCGADTDGDTLEDGWEYEAALDLNWRDHPQSGRPPLPYPGKRPYPNPLDATDADVDHDSDGLSARLEHSIWVKLQGRRMPMASSDGTQHSGGLVPVPSDPGLAAALNLNDDAWLTDDERDHDGDRLPTWSEATGTLQQEWWPAVYKDEKPYTLTFLEPDPLDPDTDGDGVLDGDDDQDHDDWTNSQEVKRRNGGFMVQPYNPCLPTWLSRSCALHPPSENSYPPFDKPLPGAPAPPIPWPRP